MAQGGREVRIEPKRSAAIPVTYWALKQLAGALDEYKHGQFSVNDLCFCINAVLEATPLEVKARLLRKAAGK